MDFITKYIDPVVFIIALGIGFLMTYIFAPQPTVIMKHPTPYNTDDVTYVDNSGVCYKYRAEEVNCPKDKSKIKSIPLK